MFEPLAGIRILDVSRLVPGAAVTHRFADLGADVIKVEQPPVGDYLREVLPHVDGISIQHLMLDRNKRSIALDFREPEGLEVLHAMVREADAVVEGSRPGAMAARGAGWEQLHEVNPRLVYLSFSGYGQESRYASLPSHGSNMAAFAGVNPVRRREDGVIVHAPTPYGNYRIPMDQAALQAAFVLLAALRERDRTGEGRYLDVALVHALMLGDSVAMTDTVNNGEVYWRDLPQPTPRYAYYEASDGRTILVCPLERRFWTSFCELIGAPELAERGDWSAREMDFGNADTELYRQVQERISTADSEHWLELLYAAGIPCSPVNSIEEACADPDLGGRLFVDRATLESGREVELMGPVFQDPPRSFRSRPAPEMGRDGAEILADTEVPSELIDAAIASGALALEGAAR